MRKTFTALLILMLLPCAALAQTVTVDRVTRHIGAGTGSVLDTHADVPACLSAVAASAPTGNNRCHVWVTKTAAPAAGPTYYFSDCQIGAAIGCLPGSNANAGTSASAPKQNLTGFNYNALPAGSRILFARGGAWTNFSVQLQNNNATSASPMVFDSYAASWGSSVRPLLRSSNYAFQFGAWNNMTLDGGYVVRNLRLDGGGSAGTWGVHLRNQTRDVVIENNEITGFGIGLHFGNEGTDGQLRLTIRNNLINNNGEMGLLGAANDMVIEGNTFENNNFSGSIFNHAIYLSGSGRNATIRGNTFRNNSTVNGVCQGGNVTAHGQWEGILIENNTLSQVASAGGCWGFSVTAGYTGPEWLNSVVVRGNTIINLGGCAICTTSAPGALIERNKIINDQAAWQIGVSVPVETPVAGDVANGNATVRDNVVCFSRPTSSTAYSVSAATVNTGNVYRSGADATTGVCAR